MDIDVLIRREALLPWLWRFEPERNYTLNGGGLTMKSDWAFVTASHEPIKQALLPYRGKEITIPEWDALVQAVVGVGPAKYIHASDHCSNMSNVGAYKKCAAKTGEALVERITPGSRPALYLVR
jgi:hypothetical protein